MKRSALAIGILALGLGCVGHCRADDTPDVINLRIDLDNGWRLHPAMWDSTLVGYLSEQVAGATAPLGYSLVWFERQPDGTFSMSGYDGLSRVSAATKIEVTRGQPGLFKHCEFAGDMSAGDTEATSTFAAMASGLALADPAQPIASSLPPEVMDVYVQAGGQGAAALSGEAVATDPTCPGTADAQLQAKLGSYTVQTEGIISSGGEEVPCVTAGNALASIFGCCWPGCGTSAFDWPAGPWASTNPTGNPCYYSRPTTHVSTTCCISLFCATTCTTTRTTGPVQTGSCPGNPSGNCAPKPGPGCHP